MKITYTKVYNIIPAIWSMRNSMNSWEKSDSYEPLGSAAPDVPYTVYGDDADTQSKHPSGFEIGPNDLKLAQTLIRAGSEHCKFLRMIHVSANFDMPRYWWSEADTYHFGTKNSCSTMHKLLNTNTPITIDQFVYCEEDSDVLQYVIARLEFLRLIYKKIQNDPKEQNKQELLDRLLLRAKRLLPESFLQFRTWDTNYAELRNIYFQRRHHRLKEEWVDTVCAWIKTLPYAEDLITYEG